MRGLTRYNHGLFHKIIEALVALGPLGLLAVSFADSVGVPIATGLDALLILIAVKVPQNAYWGAAAATAGSLLGNYSLFHIAQRGGRKYLERAGNPERVRRFRLWFERYGLVTIFIPALLPIPLPLKLFVISAGALQTSVVPFLCVVALARTIRFFGDAWMGVTLGVDSGSYLKAHSWHFVGAALLLFGALFSLIRLNDHWRQRLARPQVQH
jgi:membrane protein YqaA with SNARE-associated domain